MSKKNIIILLIALIVAGCNKNEVSRQLAMADSLLYNNYVDSAKVVLGNIACLTKEDSAYYYVLKAETDYRQGEIPDTNEINYSTNYFGGKNDNRKLANAYYYKACAYIVTCNSLPKECFILLKQAEKLSEKTSDLSLKNKICSALAYANGIKNQPEEAIKYAKKEYYYAKQLNARRDIAYALLRLSTSYKEIGQTDSAEYYIMQCKMLANAVNDDDKSYINNMLGECFMQENYDAALQYFHTALKYKKIPETYKNLAKIYLKKNDTLNWRIYCDSALSDAWYETKIDILSDIAQKYYDDNDIVSYKSISDQMIGTLKDFNDYEKKNFALEVQKKYDFEKQQTEYEKNIWFLIAVIGLLTAASLAFAIIYKHNSHKIKQLEKENTHLYENQKLSNEINDEYKSQLVFLREQNEEMSSKSENFATVIAANNDMIAKLRSKIDEMNKQNNDYLTVGKAIFDRMNDNLSIANYKMKYANCLLYFETTYPDHTYIFDSYINLTIENKIFLICDDYMGKNDDEMSSIFNISPTTVRTRRTKMKRKLA